MGWSSGTDIAEAFEALILKYVPKDKIIEEATKALEILEDQDWDCQDEVPLFDYLVDKRMLEDSDVDDEDIDEFKERVANYEKKLGL